MEHSKPANIIVTPRRRLGEVPPARTFPERQVKPSLPKRVIRKLKRA